MATPRAYYSATIPEFLNADGNSILGTLALHHEFALEIEQRDAWSAEITIFRRSLYGQDGAIYLEYSVPRMGSRIDAVLLIGAVVFVLEFKVGECDFSRAAVDQVWDYALDLKNFHDASATPWVAPVLVATDAVDIRPTVKTTDHGDRLLCPVLTNAAGLPAAMRAVQEFALGEQVHAGVWENGSYRPTPTIIEAAKALYGGHGVADISRSDAAAINLTRTSNAISDVIERSRAKSIKSICFISGVPGAGKTLIGLNVATAHFDRSTELYSVFLSGNGPLVAVLREALARDRIRRARERGERMAKGVAASEVKVFIQNVHHFRDDCLANPAMPPLEHVALFDEAQRAWNSQQTAEFMRRKKKRPNFDQSEPEFLISCLDRHQDWAVVVCLVGGGQEINRGEAGIGEWIRSLNRSFPEWHCHISPRLIDNEYGAGAVLSELASRRNVTYNDALHLAVSMRSFRAEHVSSLVKHILDLDVNAARRELGRVKGRYPIALTRDIRAAKEWLQSKARGSERFGIVVSSQAQRLKPYAIDVRSPVDPIHWFLDGKEDVRSSYFLEDVATEFHVQGLELDWACVAWDADLRYQASGWEHWSFKGDRWERIRKEDRRTYQKNAYRVLLTRARQGMVIVVPEGSNRDGTRKREFYDPTFQYLREMGFDMI